MSTCRSPPKPPGPVACIPPWRGRGRSRRIASNQPYTHRLKSHWVNGHKQVGRPKGRSTTCFLLGQWPLPPSCHYGGELTQLAGGKPHRQEGKRAFRATLRPRGAGSGPPESQAEEEGAGANRVPQGARGHLGARLTTVLGTSQPPPCGPRGCSELAQPPGTPLGALGTSGMPGELLIPISSRPSGS